VHSSQPKHTPFDPHLRHGEQQSKLSFAWLLDHARENREPGTGQRKVRISQFNNHHGAAQSGLRPLEVRTEDGTLEIRWPESVEQHGGSRVSRFLVSELLDAAAEARPLEDSRVAWGARLFSQEGHPTVAAAELRCEEGLRGALLRLRDYGVLRLREMPSSSRETRELVEVPRHATPRHATPRHATPRHTAPRHTLPHTATSHGRARGAHLDDGGAAHRRGAADLLRRDVVDPRRGWTDGGRERHGLLQRGHPAAH
jgi:hypothetical protein